MVVKIIYRGEELEVEGTFIKGEAYSYTYPGSPAEFEIESVYFQGVDIYPFVEEDLTDIETVVLENI